MEREEKDPSNPNQTSKRILEQPNVSATNRKHAAMLERLSNRKEQSLSRKSDSSSLDSTQSFLHRFSQSKLSIESDISLCRQSTDETESTLKSDIERISISIANLEKLVAENSYSLPSFEVRTCLEAISDLKQTLDTVASDVAPKKRFAFKKKKKDPSTGVENRIDYKTPESQSEQRSFVVRHSPGFKDRENEILVKEFVGSEMGEFSISGLNSCEVRLKGCLNALFVHNLRNCKVYVGPVFGSVLIEEVEGCVFVLTSHQIRIHDARGSDFYLRVRSRPIIEHCSCVRFAPYCLGYEGIQRDLKESNLDEETGNWANVDDFLWLKAVQSPNWSILPESERIGRVTIMNSEK